MNAITSTQVEEQFRFIDAAIEAGIKRYVPSEYGLNNLRPEARALNAVFDGKGKVQEYLKSKESTGLTWHAIGCGMWIDWSVQRAEAYCHLAVIADNNLDFQVFEKQFPWS